jgi:DNA-directed RNA polymerase subunit RPC12/RpoP
MENIIRVLGELFVIFNYRYFGGSLIKPVMTVQSNSRHSPGVMGWCTASKVWQETETQEEYYEIAVCPEFFDQGIVEISDTLLHELVHAYHLQNQIQDTSRGGHYHNKTFKHKAEECGMFVEKSPVTGWSQTSLRPETKEYVEGLNIDREAFQLMRKRQFSPAFTVGDDELDQSGENNGRSPTPPKPRQSSRKYICPRCGMKVRATKDVNVKCGDCDLQMEKENKEPARRLPAASNYRTFENKR